MRMRCRRCGAQFKDARYCPNCGIALRQRPSGVYTEGGGYVEGNVRTGRDYIGRDKNDIHDSSGLYYVTTASGISRFLIVVGFLLAFTGFGLFGYAIFDSMFQDIGTGEPGDVSQPDFAMLERWAPIGFGLMFVGIVVGNIGLLMFRRRD